MKRRNHTMSLGRAGVPVPCDCELKGDHDDIDLVDVLLSRVLPDEDQRGKWWKTVTPALGGAAPVYVMTDDPYRVITLARNLAAGGLL